MLDQEYSLYCSNRLPCGICRLTNSQCPKCFVGTDITWNNKVTNATVDNSIHTNPEDSYHE